MQISFSIAANILENKANRITNSDQIRGRGQIAGLHNASDGADVYDDNNPILVDVTGHNDILEHTIKCISFRRLGILGRCNCDCCCHDLIKDSCSKGRLVSHTAECESFPTLGVLGQNNCNCWCHDPVAANEQFSQGFSNSVDGKNMKLTDFIN